MELSSTDIYSVTQSSTLSIVISRRKRLAEPYSQSIERQPRRQAASKAAIDNLHIKCWLRPLKKRALARGSGKETETSQLSEAK